MNKDTATVKKVINGYRTDDTTMIVLNDQLDGKVLSPIKKFSVKNDNILYEYSLSVPGAELEHIKDRNEFVLNCLSNVIPRKEIDSLLASNSCSIVHSRMELSLVKLDELHKVLVIGFNLFCLPIVSRPSDKVKTLVNKTVILKGRPDNILRENINKFLNGNLSRFKELEIILSDEISQENLPKNYTFKF